MENQYDTAAAMLARMQVWIAGRKSRSTWENGVDNYAITLIWNLMEYEENGYLTLEDLTNETRLTASMLNGAKDWQRPDDEVAAWSVYNWGGCSLIYDWDIAKRLCTASELKRTHNGERRPNVKEEWLDVQARALYQAAQLVKQAARMCAFIDENGEPIPRF